MTTTHSVSIASGDAALADQNQAAVSLRAATLSYGDRVLWRELDLDVRPGEFVAVLGPNGSGKTSLIRVLLGQQPLSAGTMRIVGGKAGIGYVPQQRAIDTTMGLRGRDLVGFGFDGHRFGIGWKNRRARQAKVNEALAAVDATSFADKPIGLLSGGEQQRLRVAQALIGEPSILLCDEPLLSLDLAHQRAVSQVIDRRRKAAATAVLFVTHEINPILPMVDRVLYLVNGRFRIGTPASVLTTEVLSELYQTDVRVVRVRDQIHVVGALPDFVEEPHHIDGLLS